jgi:hypothetical protein
MVIVSEPSTTISDEELLKKSGFINMRFSGNTTFEECLHPHERSLSIGRYKNCLVINDDYQLSSTLEILNEPQKLSAYEYALTNLYPQSEILTVACHGAVNYHLYSLVKNGKKLRFKRVVNGEPTIEHGEKIPEEEKIYQYSKIFAGERMFKKMNSANDEYNNTEDDMMEEFTFEVAKRELGITIFAGDNEDLMYKTVFKKYVTGKLQGKNKDDRTTYVTASQIRPVWLSKFFKRP